MDLLFTVAMVLMNILLVMSVAAFCVHLVRSVREFRAGYAEAPQQLTM